MQFLMGDGQWHPCCQQLGLSSGCFGLEFVSTRLTGNYACGGPNGSSAFRAGWHADKPCQCTEDNLGHTNNPHLSEYFAGYLNCMGYASHCGSLRRIGALRAGSRTLRINRTARTRTRRALCGVPIEIARARAWEIANSSMMSSNGVVIELDAMYGNGSFNPYGYGLMTSLMTTLPIGILVALGLTILLAMVALGLVIAEACSCVDFGDSDEPPGEAVEE